MAAFPGFVGPAYAGANPVSANEALINWYMAKVETPGAPFPWELLPTPGVSQFASVVQAGGRGAWAADGRCLVVFGDTLYDVGAGGTMTSRGTIAVDTNPVMFAYNGEAGNQVVLSSGGNLYSFDLVTNTLTLEITGDVLMVGFVDGFFVAFGAAQFRISDLFDGTTWDPLQFARRSIRPDRWQSMLVDPYGYITLLGSQTGESWVNVDAFPFPFAPDRSGLIEEGIAAPFSFAQAGKSRVWLATNVNGGYQIVRARGFATERISHHALETAIAGYSPAVIAAAIAATYEDKGHAFYLLTFPGVATWCFDFTTGFWHQRGTWIAENSAYAYWRPVFHCFAFGKHLAADRESGVLYDVSDTYGVDVESRVIRRLRRSAAVTNEHQLVFFDNLEILMQTGVGVSSGTDEDKDPQGMLRISNDFGQTFGSERRCSLGKIGVTAKRVTYWLLGQGRGRVYEFVVTAAVPARITGAFQKVRATQEAA